MNIIINSLTYLVWFLSTYFVILLLLSVFNNRKRLFEATKKLQSFPFVTVIVPAFNEEETIASTINSLKQVNYPENKIEYIFVNDGSKDTTSDKVQDAIRGDARFKFIDRKENKGKAFSLNEGISQAKGEFIACMDADSIVETEIFQKALPYFSSDNIGAVTVTVEVLNPKSWLDKVIAVEYHIGLSLFLKIFSFFNCIFVTPGPFSIYRKSLLLKIGGFDITNITEDHEIAFRIHKGGFRIVNCFNAKVCTILPKTFRGLYRQRRRWYAGAIQSLFQHRDVIFNKNLGVFGFFTPYNYVLVSLGMILFYLATFLGLRNLFRALLNYKYVSFNISHITHSLLDIDFLRLNSISFIAFSALIMTLALVMIGLWVSRKSIRERALGVAGFPIMFFLYQIFWTGAVFAVVKRRKISWR